MLDVGLPGIDGTEVCRRMRDGGDWTPVLFVTARDDEVDRIVALEMGADDYVTKPFSPRELVARLSGVLRRTTGATNEATLSRRRRPARPRPSQGLRRRGGGRPHRDGVRPAGVPDAAARAGVHAASS